jgi:hypothetical protein
MGPPEPGAQMSPEIVGNPCNLLNGRGERI